MAVTAKKNTTIKQNQHCDRYNKGHQVFDHLTASCVLPPPPPPHKKKTMTSHRLNGELARLRNVFKLIDVSSANDELIELFHSPASFNSVCIAAAFAHISCC